MDRANTLVAPSAAPQAAPNDDGGVMTTPPTPIAPEPSQRVTTDIERIVREAVEGRSTYHVVEQGRELLVALRHEVRELGVKLDELRTMFAQRVPDVTPDIVPDVTEPELEPLPEPQPEILTEEAANEPRRSRPRNTT